MNENYFDYAATTPLSSEARIAMEAAYRDGLANPSSVHSAGQWARQHIESVRELIATVMGADDPYEVIFTSGATESANLAIRSVPPGARTPFEHSAVREPAATWRILPNQGWQVDTQGAEVVAAISASNETGTIIPRPDAPIHIVDAVQSVGKVAGLASLLPPQGFLFAGAHKFYGPLGVGFLIARGVEIDPMIIGGGHESGRRAGTLNVPAILGMGAALEESVYRTATDAAQAQSMRDILQWELEGVIDMRVIDGPAQLPHIFCVSFRDVQGETLALEVDRKGFAISAGPACSAGQAQLSPTLAALGLDESWNRGAVRISFGRANTPDSTAALAREIRDAVAYLRGFARSA